MNLLQIHPSILINICLALTPLPLAYLAAWLDRRTKRFGRTIFWASVLVWLLFLPNALYPTLEWHHFVDNKNPNIGSKPVDIVDLIFVIKRVIFFSIYSGIGIFSFTISIRRMARLFHGRLPLRLVAIPVFLLVAIALYIGLFLRFNSWDLVMRPGILFHQLFADAGDPLRQKYVLASAVFVWLLYWVVGVWLEGFGVWRRGGKRGA